MNSKITVFALLMAVILMACSQAPTNNVVQDTQPIKVGFIGPLTTGMSAWGVPDRNGAQLAVDEINAQGGINGRRVQLIVEDDGCAAQPSVTAANKLITVDHVTAILGTVCSSTTLADAPIAEENKVVLLAVASSNPSVTDAGDYIFRVWPSDAFNGKILANVALNNGHKKAALLVINNDYGKGVAEVFKQEYIAGGGSIVAEELFTPGAQDFRTQVTKMKGANPDNVVVFMDFEAPAIHKQLKDLGLNVQVYGTEPYDSKPLLDSSKGDIDGTIYTMPAFNEDGGVQAFKAKYVKAFGQEPEQTIVAAYAYDSMNLIIDGLKHDPTGATLKDYLYTVQARSMVSGTISFDENGDVLRDFTAKKIVNSTPTVLIAKI